MRRGHVLTSMAVEDNVLEGDSYFLAKIRKLNKKLEKSLGIDLNSF